MAPPESGPIGLGSTINAGANSAITAMFACHVMTARPLCHVNACHNIRQVFEKPCCRQMA
jgi:hypothetical protein